MGLNHVKLSEQDYASLFNQVNGLCPKCGVALSFQKEGKRRHCKNIAHIYPLNPTEEQKHVFGNLPRLSDDLNSIDNLILLCPNCHAKYDSVPSSAEYLEMYSIKKNLIEQDKVRNTSYCNNIDEGIHQVIMNLYIMKYDSAPLEYNAVRVEKKLGSDFDKIITKRILENVTEYYVKIQTIFAEMERRGPSKFNLIASQIRATYLQIKLVVESKESIFSNMCSWFMNKTKCNSEVASIMISFFIQNCEVFDVSE